MVGCHPLVMVLLVPGDVVHRPQVHVGREGDAGYEGPFSVRATTAALVPSRIIGRAASTAEGCYWGQ